MSSYFMLLTITPKAQYPYTRHSDWFPAQEHEASLGASFGGEGALTNNYFQFLMHSRPSHGLFLQLEILS